MTACGWRSTAFLLFFIALTLPKVVFGQDAVPPDPPLFRSVSTTPPPDTSQMGDVRLLIDADFPPYSFLSASGAPAGFAVELALEACSAARLTCSIVAKPFGDLLPALNRGEGDAILIGPRLDDESLREALMTRPYFRIMARFAGPTSATLEGAGPRLLSGLRIAVAENTVHARWLSAYYGDSLIVPFPSFANAAEALKAGKADALFGDNLQVIYWVAGQQAQGCCKLLGGAYADADFFSRNLAMLVRRNRDDLRAALDYGLDMAQKSGATARIIKAYVPLPVW
jgi:polar amino acid transport system substrate-binding protein